MWCVRGDFVVRRPCRERSALQERGRIARARLCMRRVPCPNIGHCLLSRWSVTARCPLRTVPLLTVIHRALWTPRIVRADPGRLVSVRRNNRRPPSLYPNTRGRTWPKGAAGVPSLPWLPTVLPRLSFGQRSRPSRHNRACLPEHVVMSARLRALPNEHLRAHSCRLTSSQPL